MESKQGQLTAIRYRGFLLLQLQNQKWLVQPERSPMLILPFRTPVCSLTEVKRILDRKLAENIEEQEAA